MAVPKRLDFSTEEFIAVALQFLTKPCLVNHLIIQDVIAYVKAYTTIVNRFHGIDAVKKRAAYTLTVT